MKRKAPVFALVLAMWGAVPSVFAEPGELRLTVLATWDLGLRVGIEYRPVPYLGFAADLGSTLFSPEGAFMLTYNAFGIIYLFPGHDRFQLDLCVGIPDGRFAFIKPVAGEISFGASVRAGYRFKETIAGFLRVGGGAPFFWEEGEFGYRDVSFPLGLWPDLSLGVQFPL